MNLISDKPLISFLFSDAINLQAEQIERLATGWTTEESSSILGRVQNFYFFTSSRHALGPTKPPV